MESEARNVAGVSQKTSATRGRRNLEIGYGECEEDPNLWWKRILSWLGPKREKVSVI